MSTRIVVIFLTLLCLLTGNVQSEEKYINLPPDSLAQWYKPINKRQVWLHTMFNMRREVQAIEHYSEKQDAAHLKKWASDFAEHYKSLGDMVPEWSDELDLAKLDELLAVVESGEFDKVAAPLKDLQLTCKSCHGEHRALVAAIYRAPDFSNLTVKSKSGEISYYDSMLLLTRHINAIKIASVDGDYQEAVTAYDALTQEMSALGDTCEQCHKGEQEAYDRYLGQRTSAAMDELAKGISAQDAKLTGRSLGSVAVYACARCHVVHRSLSDLKKFID